MTDATAVLDARQFAEAIIIAGAESDTWDEATAKVVEMLEARDAAILAAVADMIDGAELAEWYDDIGAHGIERRLCARVGALLPQPDAQQSAQAAADTLPGGPDDPEVETLDAIERDADLRHGGDGIAIEKPEGGDST